MWNSIKKSGNEWVIHVLKHNGLLEIITEGRIEGKNCRSRPRLEYVQQIVKNQ